jgi:hypothetical protein
MNLNIPHECPRCKNWENLDAFYTAHLRVCSWCGLEIDPEEVTQQHNDRLEQKEKSEAIIQFRFVVVLVSFIALTIGYIVARLAYGQNLWDYICNISVWTAALCILFALGFMFKKLV